jgi:phosphopantothenoylcysteine decarboxylase/phosphopantothenate--cysteine ligase
MATRKNSPRPGAAIVLGVTGSIAAYKAAELASRLTRDGAEVFTIMTAAAEEFVRPLTFQTLTGHSAACGLFAAAEEWDPRHISLARRADLVLIAPATADIIGKAANGLADDLLSATLLATRAPVLMAPAMNTGMYENPAVRENIARLQKRGFHFVGPASGRLACGEEGAGRLADLEDILAAIDAILSARMKAPGAAKARGALPPR